VAVCSWWTTRLPRSSWTSPSTFVHVATRTCGHCPHGRTAEPRKDHDEHRTVCRIAAAIRRCSRIKHHGDDARRCMSGHGRVLSGTGRDTRPGRFPVLLERTPYDKHRAGRHDIALGEAWPAAGALVTAMRCPGLPRQRLRGQLPDAVARSVPLPLAAGRRCD